MFGVDDLSDHGGSTIVHHKNNPGAYHLRMISYRSTLTNRTGLGRNEGEVSAVHLHRDPVFSHWKVRSHSSPDRFTGQRSLGESTSGEFVDKSTSHLCSTGPGGLLEGTGRDKSHRPNPRNRIGPDRTGCQYPDESISHGTGPNWVSISRRVHRSQDSRAIYRSKDVRLVYRSAQTVFCTTWKNSNGAKVIH